MQKVLIKLYIKWPRGAKKYRFRNWLVVRGIGGNTNTQYL